jgi:hypothetical protein
MLSVPRTTKMAERYDRASDFDFAEGNINEEAPVVEVRAKGAFHPGAGRHLRADTRLASEFNAASVHIISGRDAVEKIVLAQSLITRLTKRAATYGEHGS